MSTSVKATRANAISTFISGLTILIFRNQLASIFEINQTLPFMVVGGVITFFSLTMFIEIKKQRALAIFLIIVQDTIFAMGSIFIIITQPFSISELGYLLIALFLIPVFFFIIIQSKGIIEMDKIKDLGVKRLIFKRTINKSSKIVWNVISDLENYHKVASNIDSVKVVSGEGAGMVRSCSHGKDSWTEICVLWEDKSQYSFIVDTNAPDYPYPFKYLKGTWKINEITNNKTEIEMIFDFKFNKGFQNLLLYPILKTKFSKVCENLLEKWKNLIENKN